jgi:hypothetical protein
MKKLLNWLDNNILTIFSFFLIAFIPLYPKIPLAELIPGYIVRLRLEDIFIFLAFLVFLIQVVRKKATFKAIIFWPMVIYLSIGLFSCFSAIFITKNIPWDKLHMGKMFLHWLRRIEYFSIFFIFYNGIKTLKNFKKVIVWLLFIITALSIYGFGQKYLYWPVYSTMNREFSKGMRLYLTEHARVPSTFGGHYDLAAFLVIFLILFISLFLTVKNKLLKFLSLFVFLFAYGLLILTASRTSFIAYLGGLTILFFILGLKKTFRWALPRWAGFIIFSLLIMMMFGDLSERFAHFFNMPKIKSVLGLDKIFKPFKAPPPNSIGLSDEIKLVMDRTDERPVEEKPTPSDGGAGMILPPDVYENLPDLQIATSTATASAKTKEYMATMSGKMIQAPRTFSENAYKYGLSTAIRLDSLWPWAIEGFKRNPLLGSGYSTLNKTSLGDFTEAESTDNDYLRILGETGLLGFISFFAIIFIFIKTALKIFHTTKNVLIYGYAAAVTAYTIGLLINAVYIDIFEASKVALTFWALVGIFLALIKFVEKGDLSKEKLFKKK